jgi:hypothetical protein
MTTEPVAPDDLIARLIDPAHCNDWYLRQEAAAALSAAREEMAEQIRIANACRTAENHQRSKRKTAEADLARARDEARLYHELLYAVAQKFPNETRHQTALRYIIERERGISTQEMLYAAADFNEAEIERARCYWIAMYDATRSKERE